MREILFRGKGIKGFWNEGLLAHIGNAWYISNKAGVATAFEVIPETVGQYTGLTDKNDKRIFEGDIIKDDWGKIYKVFYSLKSCSFMLECTKTPNEWEKGHYRIGEAWCKTIRVIGNIYDNSELLEDTK